MATGKHKQIDSAERILSAGRLEFSKYGLAGARVDRIARRAGINKAMIYYHFRSKENLYQEVINKQFSSLGKFLVEKMSEDSDFEQSLYGVATFYNTMFEDFGDFTPIFLREIASGGHRIKAALARSISEKGLTKRLKSIIDSGKKNGLFRNLDSRQTIISFIGMNIFYLIMAPAINSIWEIKDEKKFRRQRPKEVVNLFLHGLKVR